MEETTAGGANLTERDKFILSKSEDFTPLEIQLLLEREGFKPITHGRIYQILSEHNIKPRANRPNAFKAKSPDSSKSE